MRAPNDLTSPSRHNRTASFARRFSSKKCLARRAKSLGSLSPCAAHSSSVTMLSVGVASPGPNPRPLASSNNDAARWHSPTLSLYPVFTSAFLIPENARTTPKGRSDPASGPSSQKSFDTSTPLSSTMGSMRARPSRDGVQSPPNQRSGFCADGVPCKSTS